MSEHTGPQGVVVVGVDGSEKDDDAVDWAGDEAVRRGTGLHVVYAFPWIISAREYGTAPTAEVRRVGGRITDAAADRARSRHPALAVTSAVVMEDAAEALLHASRDAAVVVMGARGLGPVAGTLRGSVSQKVTAHAQRPVVVVRGPATSGPVVVGIEGHIEGHEDAGEVLRFAFEQAAARGVGVRVVHADTWEQPSPRYRDERIDEALAKVAAAHERAVADLAETWARRYPEVAVEVRQEREHPVVLLVRQARDGCLLVVGSRTRRGLAALRLGSVTRGVLHQATVVAVVPVGATPTTGADGPGQGPVTPG